MRNMKEKYGPWALVTGASEGIGRAFAQELGKQGINTVLVARREKELTQLGQKISGKYGVRSIPVPLNLTSENFLSTLEEQLKDIRINILVNSAGYGSSNYFHLNDPAGEGNMVKLNCHAPVVLTRYFVNSMIEDKKGAIIFVSSIGAIQPTPRSAVYSATKVFDFYLGDALSYELKPKGVDVITILPGPTNTKFQEASGFQNVPDARHPEDVVKTTLKYIGKKRSVIDGFSNRLNSRIMKWLPKKLQLLIAHKYMEQRALN